MINDFLVTINLRTGHVIQRLILVVFTLAWIDTIYAATIPAASDWTERDAVIIQGAAGSWDVNLGGSITPATIINKNGVYYLYYVGADGYRTDGGPRHRALGVATSTDGINFTKYAGNPILTFRHKESEDAGVFSAAATLDETENVVLYYSACSPGVVCDGRVATSPNGLDFTDVGLVLPWNGAIWGAGDELFPVGAFTSNGSWYVYYIAKNPSFEWQLGLASGPALDNLTNTQGILTSGKFVVGGMDPVKTAADELVVFTVRDFETWQIEVRTTSLTTPNTLSQPVTTYDFNEALHVTPYLDAETGTWFMYYLTAAQDQIRVKTAGSGAILTDTISPNSPSGLSAN